MNTEPVNMHEMMKKMAWSFLDKSVEQHAKGKKEKAAESLSEFRRLFTALQKSRDN